MVNTHQVINPYNQEVAYEYEYTTEHETHEKLNLLIEGKETQAGLTPYDRFQTLQKLGRLIQENKARIAAYITMETGKIIKESLVEVERALKTIEVSAEEAKRINGESQHANNYGGDNGLTSLTVRRPLGVVLCITPFNFPLNLALHKICPAFAAGNTILLKPSECNYKLGEFLVELCHKAGFPENSIQFIMPEIPTLNGLVAHPEIQVISFTGGTETADKIAKTAGRKKLLFELGGNDPLIVYPDADLDKAVKAAVAGRFGTAGQKCTASKRVFVHSEIYEKFKTNLLEETKKLVMGDPKSSETSLGPLISEAAATKLEDIMEDVKASGGTVLCGGKREGAFFEATVVEDFDILCDLVQTETFGPILPLFKFDTDQEVLDIVNSSDFGLQAGVFTQDLQKIKFYFENLEVGSVIINEGPGFRQEYLPFGGIKDSGLGREGVKYAIEELTYIKQLIF